MKKKQLFTSIFFLILLSQVFLWNWQRVVWRSYYDTFSFVCDMVEERYFDRTQTLVDWVVGCRNEASKVSAFSGKQQLLANISSSLRELGVSHLEIYNPEEDRQIWSGVAKYSGMRARAIDGHFIVYYVMPKSPAEKSGVKVGDEVLLIKGEGVLSAVEVELTAGEYLILRGEKEITMFIDPVVLKIDSAPRLKAVRAGVAVLSITSFRSEYFAKSEWSGVAKEIAPLKHLIIDLRGNLGGNFVAMLRALSSFVCEAETIGELHRRGYAEGIITEFDDKTESAYQLETVYQSRVIRLNTFEGYGCYQGRLTVLTDFNTASVSEVFANTIKERERGLVLGAATSGQMVMGIWYEMPMLGKGYSLSIPEANFTSKNGVEIEGDGVWPHRSLYYDIDLERRGIDSWVDAALK